MILYSYRMPDYMTGPTALAGGGTAQSVPHNDSVKMRDRFADSYAQSRFFVFNTRPPEIKDIVIRHHDGVAGHPILDLPFSVCLFEMLGGPIAVFDKGNLKRLIMAMLVSEVRPGAYNYFVLEGVTEYLEKGKIELGVAYLPWEWKDDDALFEYHALVREMVDQLRASDNAIGTIKQKEHVKIGHGPERRKHKIREVIFITPTKQKASAGLVLGKEVDWTHRWEVRGHWRKTTGIGKDREGQYCVNGLTWVVPHEKGPDDKPVVRKQRLVKE